MPLLTISTHFRTRARRYEQLGRSRGSGCLSSRNGHLHHALLDASEDAAPGGVEHLDRDRVARLHERRARLAALDDLDHPPLREAGDAARAVAVRHRAGAEDGPGAEAPGP